ncbi:MAG: glycine C-acetyltransferase [bacterium]|nr:glycine C-acetyltransferase [bacterium]
MFTEEMREHLVSEIEQTKSDGLYKTERILLSPQSAKIRTSQGDVINFCANNYLGLANHPRLIAAAKKALDERGLGLASVRFICGTQDLHKQLEETIATFFGTEDTILYAACFDANGGVFEPLLHAEDALISDELNHASIIDGIRLCKAERFRYRHKDMTDLEEILRQAQEFRFRIVVTDGVFSMDGDLAPLQDICRLCEKYQALVMVDDCHGTGFLGENGRGSCEATGVLGRVDIITSTLGKAMGGATGGFTTGRKEIIEWLRQKSRPYLFSNTLAPVVAAAGIEAFHLVDESNESRERLTKNTRLFRESMIANGFNVRGETPICPVMIGDSILAQKLSARLLEEGVYVIAFSYPVVPKGTDRIRVQISAAHSEEQIRFTVDKFAKVGKELGVISA